MLKCLFIIALSFCTTANIYAQEDLKAEEVPGTIASLKAGKQDTSQVNTLLRLSHFYIFKPGENKTDLDSAVLLINQATELSKKLSYNEGLANCNYQLSMAFREKGEKEKGKSYITSAIAIADKTNRYNLQGDCYLEYAQYFSAYQSNEIDGKLKAFEDAATAFHKAGNIEREAFSIKNIADVQIEIGNNGLAANELKQALALYQSIKYPAVQGIYQLLAVVYTDISDLHSALSNAILATQTAEKTKDTSAQLCSIYYITGTIYSRMKEYPQAIEHYEKALAIARKYNNLRDIYLVADQMVYINNSIGNPAAALQILKETVSKYPFPQNDPAWTDVSTKIIYMFMSIYLQMNKPEECTPYYNQLTKLLSTQDIIKRGNVASYVIKYFIAMKQYGKAEEYLRMQDEWLTGVAIKNAAHRNNRVLWFKLDSARGNYLSAIKYYQQYKTLMDSAYNSEKTKMAGALQIEFETAQKEQDIKIKNQAITLLTQENERAKLLRNGVLAGIAIMLIIVGLLYNQYRIKQKANRDISQKNVALEQLVEEKEWLLKEVHHRVKNNLQTVVSLLESQAAYLNNEARQAIQESQNRIYTMSLIHQKLYQPENVSSIKMHSYLPELVSYLREGFHTDGKIRFSLQIAPVELDVSQAIPVGLILNEAITNAIKHAFPEQRPNNEIVILLEQQEDSMVALSIRDNGKGFSPNRNSTGLGMKLMKGLTEEIGGNFDIAAENGTKITIRFRATILLHETNKISKALNA
ncbi:MAG: histidine kinase dimerization/phosphoacceptor domain -containing protein [Chitinophagaceae bacterium]